MTSSTFSVTPPRAGVHEALVEGEVLHPPGPLLAVDHFGEEVRVPPFGVHVRDRQETVEVVEADVLGLGFDVLPDVPLAHRLGHVAVGREQLGQGHLAVEPTGLAVHRRSEQAVAHGKPARHDRGPRRGAGRLRVARGQQLAAPGQPVDVRGWRPDRHSPAVTTEVTPAHIVEEDEQDVGLPAGVAAVAGQGLSGPVVLVGQDEVGLEAVALAHRVGHYRVMCHRCRSLIGLGRC